jgi:hypothetical protein
MARKALKRRASAEEAADAMNDYSTMASPATSLLTPEALRATDPDRTRLLLSYTPRSDIEIARQVQDAVVDLILRVEHVSWHSDQAMLKIAYAYAIHCVKVHGEWAPARHLLDGQIKQWANGRQKTANTRSSELAALRRLRVGRRHVSQFSRNVATPPYTAKEWKPLQALSESRVDSDATALVNLSGHLGLRAHELSRATGNWIHLDEERTWLTVPDSDGVLRLIPAFGDTADWLRSMYAVGDRYLIRPRRKWRSSLVTDVTVSISSKHSQFAGFKVNAARHMFVTRLLGAAVPLAVVHSVAGLKPGSTLPVDLVAYLSEPNDNVIYQALRRTHRHQRPSPTIFNSETSPS